MTRSLAVMISLVASVGLAGAQENLLRNPSFEEVDPGTGKALGWRQLAGPAVELRDDGGHTGDRYVHFADPAADVGISLESEHLPCRVGGTYRLSAWVRVHDACSPGIYIQFHSDLGERIAETHVRKEGPTEGWVRIQAEAGAPPEAFEVSALLYAYIGDVGQFDFDDVVLTVEGGHPPDGDPTVRARPGEKTMVDIGSRLELFVDDYLVDALAGDARRLLHHPVPQEVALVFDRPWEGATSAYVTVFRDGERVRLYYRGNGAGHETTCYAESRDGVHFERPNLGLFEFAGSTENNIIWLGAGTHNFAPFLDTNPAAPPEQRYKALASAGPKASLVPFASPDGVHWSKIQEDPVITEGAFDSQNLAFFDEHRGQYAAFVRDFRDGVRTIRYATSPDFIHWSTPEWLDYGDAPPEHLYTNATVAYFRAPHLFLAFPKRFVPGRTKDPQHPEPGLSDGVLMSSRDGVHWQRWREAFLRPGPDPANWTERNMGFAWGLVPASETEIALYWWEHYRHDDCRLRRGTVRTDGFVSVHAGAAGGEMLTRPLVFSGSRLVVNYSTSAVGALRFELCDEQGEPLPGLSLADSEVLFGDEIAHEVAWREATCASVAGRPVRLRVRLRDADLYSIQFAD